MTGRILVIDGVATNRILMKVRLTAACYDVIAVSSAQEALQMLKNDLPQIILIGATLPDQPAVNLCRTIRALPGCRKLPIMIQASDEQRVAALNAGATAILEKANDELTLLARIRGLLRAGGAEVEDMAYLIEPETHSNALAESAHPEFGADDKASKQRIVFIGEPAPGAISWRQALQGQLGLWIEMCDPERSLAEAQAGQPADVYLIAADINQPGDGFRLLSELRSRRDSRHAAFLIVLRPEREDMTAVALDLGAGDVLSSKLNSAAQAAEAAIRVRAQLERKHDMDRRRRETQRNLRWAMTDPLTGLYNRRYAMPHLAEMIGQTLDSNKPLVTVIMDLDRFKAINDLYGHAAGDAVLVSVAARLREIATSGMMLARIGGEEFVAAFHTNSVTAAQDFAETIRRAVSDRPFLLPVIAGGAALEVTISLGVAILMPDELQRREVQVEQILARADRALLSAKTQGRNRLVLAPNEIAA